MNSRVVNLSLLAVSLGLVALVAYLVYFLEINPVTERFVAKPEVITNTVTKIAVRKVNATNLWSDLISRSLNWSRLESTNYVTYIANLRSFGCPEETIRDIIITDVAKLYAKRRAVLRAQLPPPQFWQTGEAWDGGVSSSPELQRQLRELDREQRALVKELLGVDYTTEIAKYFSEDDALDRQYGFLSPDKREKVLALLQRFDEMEQDFYVRTRGLLLDTDDTELKKIQKQREQELAKILTPEELEEYQLRNSPTAQGLRAQLRGFEPNEEEFRKIFELQKTFDDTLNEPLDPDSDKDSEIRARAQQEAKQALEDEIKKSLGDKRYAEYQRAQDNDYRTLLQLSERFDVPQDVAAKVYDMKLEVEKRRQQLESNPNLADEARRSGLAAIARETDKELSKVLSPDVYKAYRKSGASWIRRLSVPPSPLTSENELSQ